MEKFLTGKRTIQNALHEQFTQWEGLAENICAEDALKPIQDNCWSVKDIFYHLYAWQQVTNARMQAAFDGGEPLMPGWLEGGDPESEALLDIYNAHIYQLSLSLSWQQVRQVWKKGYEELLAAAEKICESDLADEKKFTWLKGHPISTILEGTVDHHREHFKDFQKHSGMNKG